MTHRIFTLTKKAIDDCMEWDAAIAAGELETVDEFDTYEEAVQAFEDGCYDPDLYGCE